MLAFDADEGTLVRVSLPIWLARKIEGEVQKLVRMESRLSLRVIGQDEAIRAIANAVRRGRAGVARHLVRGAGAHRRWSR